MTSLDCLRSGMLLWVEPRNSPFSGWMPNSIQLWPMGSYIFDKDPLATIPSPIIVTYVDHSGPSDHNRWRLYVLWGGVKAVIIAGRVNLTIIK